MAVLTPASSIIRPSAGYLDRMLPDVTISAWAT